MLEVQPTKDKLLAIFAHLHLPKDNIETPCVGVSDINVYDGDVALTFLFDSAVIYVRRCSWLLDGYSRIFRSYVFGPSSF